MKYNTPVGGFQPVNTDFKAAPRSWSDGLICHVKDFCAYSENTTKEQHEEVYAQLRKLSRGSLAFEEACSLYNGEHIMVRRGWCEES